MALTTMAKAPRRSTHRSPARFNARMLAGARPADYPGFIEPCLATLRDYAPPGDRWVREIKFDGYRMQAHLNGGESAIYTRRGHNWTARLPALADALKALPANDLILDGELIVQGEEGHSDFGLLQEDLGSGRQDRMVYYAFDLLFLDGFDLRAAPLIERKRVLSEFLPRVPPLVYSEHLNVDGAEMMKRVCELGLEGIISKQRDAPYYSGRGAIWIKAKCVMTDRFTIVGYVLDVNGALGALRLAKREKSGLVYVGKVGTGFTRASAQSLRKRLDLIQRTTSPVPRLRKPETIWVEPKVDAEIDFRAVTSEGYLRHPSFKGVTEE
jgi:bifunctional non-homologous end joining protein LigD